MTFNLTTLSAYTGIFPGGYIGSYDASVLTNYVNSGGNVYLAGGTGAIASEDSVWDSFLNNFGFEFGPSYNGIGGNIAPSTAHPLFSGVSSLSYDSGNTVILTGGNPNAQLIATTVNGAGLIGIYEVRQQDPDGGEIPEPATVALVGLGLLATAWLRRR